MSGDWKSGWATGDIEQAAEFKKGVGAIFDSTLGASAANVDITSIVGSYAHLWLVVYARTDDAVASTSFNVRLNADAGANYDAQILKGKGSAVTSAEGFAATATTGGTCPANTAGANLFGACMLFLPNYAGSTNNKAWVAVSSMKSGTATTNMEVFLVGGFWRSNAAITRITLLPALGGNFVAGTRVSLFAMGA